MSCTIRPVIFDSSESKNNLKTLGSSQLDQAGFVVVENDGVYKIEYLKTLYPASIFNQTINKCKILEGEYVHGEAWNHAIKNMFLSKNQNQSSSNNQRSDDGLLTIDEAALYLNVSRDSVERLIKTKKLPAIDVAPNPNGRRSTWRIKLVELKEFLDKRKSGFDSSSSSVRVRPLV